MANSDEPRIGDFSKPVVPRPTSTAPGAAPSGATHDALVQAEAVLSEEASRAEAALKPMASYEDKLKAAKLTKEKAAMIIDAIMSRGFYSEEIPLTRTIKIRLRTRGARDSRRANEMLEAQRWSLDAHYYQAQSRLLLAASLEQFGSQKLEYPDTRKVAADVVEKAYAERLAYVDGLADPVLPLLFKKLFTFDNQVATALEEGTIENF
jgi:hypothetical protein